MHLLLKKLTLVVAVCGLVAVSVVAPAAGQVNPGEMSDLEQRRDEITTLLADFDSRVHELEQRAEELENEVEAVTVQVELVADELERTVDARREPARTRIQIAISGFVGGDPRRSALIDEMEAVRGSDEPARRREMYGAVIDDAVVHLAQIDDQLIELGDTMTSRRARLAELQEELATTELQLTDAGAQREALRIELEEVRARIEELRLLANASVLTGLTSFDDPTRPALAVKIDNVDAAMPQAGINQADIVFVEEVEGGLTRLAAVFHSTGAEEVGPIRSMRTGDIDLLTQLNAPLFANSGGNRGARAALAASTLVDVGADSIPQGYYRDSGRSRPHNLMANTFNLWALGSGRGSGTPSPIFSFREAGTPAGPGASPASIASIGYGSTEVRYDWNGVGWARSQDGRPTVDTEGVQVAPTTVIVQITDYGVSAADAASPEAITIGSGSAVILTEGQSVQATWRRAGPGDQTEYVDADGNPISIRRGRTWIELPRPGRTFVS